MKRSILGLFAFIAIFINPVKAQTNSLAEDPAKPTAELKYTYPKTRLAYTKLEKNIPAY